MSGTVSFSLQQQFSLDGQLLIGGLVYSYAAGTTTPQNAFRDAALTNPFPNPIQLDASGRVPQLFFADGVIRIRITDMTGVIQTDADAIPVIGSSATGSTAPSTTDPNALYSTGDMKVRYGTGTLAGYVRCNGNSIGNAGSGATEFASIQCQSLFQYLWNLSDVELTVSPARGASAVADFTSTTPYKTIKLPDFRCLLLGAMDDMGGGVTNRLAFWALAGGTTKPPTTLGAAAGSDHLSMSIANLAQHNHGALIFDPTHAHTVVAVPGTAAQGAGGAAPPVSITGAQAASTITTSSNLTGVRVSDGVSLDVTAVQGGGQPIASQPPTRLVTFYMRL